MNPAARYIRRALALAGCMALSLFTLTAVRPQVAHAAPQAVIANRYAPAAMEPGDTPPSAVPLVLQGAGPATEALANGSLKFGQTPTVAPPGTCTFTALPNDNSTSGNERAPTLRNRFGRSVYLITAGELAANGLTNGSTIQGIGWNYQTAQGLTGSGPLVVYLQNTSDATNLKSTTWATAITGMTVAHNATTTLPSPAGTFDIAFSGGAPFTYTGGALYVAFDMQYPVGTLATTTVIFCNSTGLVNGLLGAQGAAAPTTLAASSFRPETRFTATVPATDGAVSQLLSYGQIPLGLAGPQSIQAIITNKGASALTNLPVTLTISGAESFTNTQVIPSLSSCGGSATVTFAGFSPTLVGSDVMTVSIPADGNNANNSITRTLTVTLPTESYKYVGTTANGGFGLGAAGTIVAKFNAVAATNVTQVIPEFFATSATTYKLAIFKDSGVGTPGNILYQDAANRTVTAAGPVTITLPAPVAVGPGTFFVGIMQTNATNASLSFDTDAPVRAGTFFLGTGTPPATWTDFSPGSNFKPNIGITLDRCNLTPTASNNGPLCAGGTLQLTSSAPGAASYSWAGPGGFTSSLQNPIIPGATAANAGVYTVTINGCLSGGTASTTAVVNTGPYAINSSAASGGTISPSAPAVACGGSATFTITPGSCSSILDVLVDGVSVGAVASYTFSNVTANHTIFASFVLNSYTITASAGTGGSITPSGATAVSCGASSAFTITPAVGYQIADVLVDGSSVGPLPSFTFSSVTANHTIAASFALATASIAGVSTTSPICPLNTCVTVPVNLTRVYSTGVLGFSVTFQLSGNLALCAGTGSVTEGSYLSGTGPTLFNVVSLGGGLYRADGALTASCGATALTGNLFNVAVTSVSAGGTGTVSITAVALRDCANHPLAVGPGAPANVAIDNQAPVVTVTSPNGGEVLAPGSSFPITWSATDNAGVANVDLAYSADGGTTFPNVIATGIPNSGSFAWTVPGIATATARVRVTAHDTGCSSAFDDSDANFAIGDVVAAGNSTTCITPANSCAVIPVRIARSDATGLRLFHVTFALSANLQLCGPTGTSVLEGSYLSNANPNTAYFVIANGGGSYTVDGTINGTPCGATAATGDLFSIRVTSASGSGTGTVTVSAVTLRDCNNNDLAASPGAPGTVTIDTAPVSVAAITTPQTVEETTLLTITPSASASSCASGPFAWTVSPALPAGSTLSPASGVITWTPACGTTGSYGPFTLTATAASGDVGASNPFTIVITHHTGSVTVAAISTPQTVIETQPLTITPSAAMGACAAGPLVWTVSPALPSGATLNPASGQITWTPACGTAGSYGPFTLTATAATAEAGSSNPFSITVQHLAGTVTVAAIPTPQTVAELSLLTITPSASASSCAAGPFTWTVSPSLPSGATFDGSTGVITWTPDCLAASGGAGGTYGPFTLTATAATAEVGNSNPFSIVVTDTPTSIGVVTAVSATQVLTGNPPGERTGITLIFTPPPGTSAVKVYRAPFGHYPYYDDNGGAVPIAPGAYPPPVAWTLTSVTASGGVDIPPTRDFWYYVVYAQNACGDVSVASSMTSGTLDYHLGDFTDGFTAGVGDNLVATNDISALGAHYGISLGASDPLGYLDVGPTTTHFVNGRPTTDRLVNFEDLVLTAINYGHVSAPGAGPASLTAGTSSSKSTAAFSADELLIESPERVLPGATVDVPLTMRGTGSVQAISVRLAWDPAVVAPVGFTTTEALQQQDGIVLSAAPGSLDAAMLGEGRAFNGETVLAKVAFRAIAAGDPRIRIQTVEGRDSRNESVAVTTSQQVQVPVVPRTTALGLAMPNPFRDQVAFSVGLASGAHVQLVVYSVTGRVIRTLADAPMQAGSYNYVWDGRDDSGHRIAAGVYYLRFVAGAARQTHTITLLK